MKINSRLNTLPIYTSIYRLDFYFWFKIVFMRTYLYIHDRLKTLEIWMNCCKLFGAYESDKNFLKLHETAIYSIKNLIIAKKSLNDFIL